MGADGRERVPRAPLRGVVEHRSQARRGGNEQASALGARQMMDAPAGTGARYRDGYVTVADGLRTPLPRLCRCGGQAAAAVPSRADPQRSRLRGSRGALSPARRVIALDFRGRGLSEYDPQPERYTPLDLRGRRAQLLASWRSTEACFVGTSLGGLVTMAIAAMAPQHIAAAILNDVGPDVGAWRRRPHPHLCRKGPRGSRAGTRRRSRSPKSSEVRFRIMPMRIG